VVALVAASGTGREKNSPKTKITNDETARSGSGFLEIHSIDRAIRQQQFFFGELSNFKRSSTFYQQLQEVLIEPSYVERRVKSVWES